MHSVSNSHRAMVINVTLPSSRNTHHTYVPDTNPLDQFREAPHLTEVRITPITSEVMPFPSQKTKEKKREQMYQPSTDTLIHIRICIDIDDDLCIDHLPIHRRKRHLHDREAGDHARVREGHLLARHHAHVHRPVQAHRHRRLLVPVHGRVHRLEPVQPHDVRPGGARRVERELERRPRRWRWVRDAQRGERRDGELRVRGRAGGDELR